MRDILIAPEELATYIDIYRHVYSAPVTQTYPSPLSASHSARRLTTQPPKGEVNFVITPQNSKNLLRKI